MSLFSFFLTAILWHCMRDAARLKLAYPRADCHVPREYSARRARSLAEIRDHR
jgi:hypothetical protein